MVESIRDDARAVFATYNIHRAVGSDGEFAPERIAAVLREIDPHVIALQEVQTGAAGRHLLQEFAAVLDAEPVSGMTMLSHDSEYGNALLSRFPVRAVERIDLTIGTHEPRGALDVLIELANGPLRIVSTHLGLRPYERRRQVRILLKHLDEQPLVPTVLMGDLNEWYLWGRPLRWLHARFQRSPAPPTFPARRPLFALDRIWVTPRQLCGHLHVHATPTARIASDHLPLVAHLKI
jgi:endonuclease/exonuclease/phosphatase family metal-dependent hydrolase